MFIHVVNMSITASIVAIAIMILRLILKNKLPKVFIYGLWAIMLIRLILPFSFSSIFSLFNVIFTPSTANPANIIQYVPQDIGLMDTPSIDMGGGIINQQINNILPPASPYNSANPMQIIMFILSAIWIMISFGMILFSSILYAITVNKLKTATLYHNKSLIHKCSEKIKLNKNVAVYVSDRINTPVVCGFIKPKIVLPLSIANNDPIELAHIITHELIHIKRYDYIIKPISLILLYIHWFNPLMWLSYILAHKDMELSCDERVLSISDDDIRKEYATALLNFSIKQNNLFNGGLLAFGEKNIKTRIKGIVSFKRPTFWMSMIAGILIVIVSIVTISNPKQDLSFLNIDNALSVLAQKNPIIAKIGEQEHAIPPHGNFLKQFEGNSWKEKKVKDSLELVSEMEFPVNENLTIRFYASEPLAMVLYDGDFRCYTIPKEVYANLQSYVLSYPVGNGDVGRSVEAYLAVITASPNPLSNLQEEIDNKQQDTVIPIAVSSNPQDYIDAHRQEYENILKMGDEALQYMLAQFQVGEAKGLKAHIMMALCIDILGNRNNVEAGTYNSPQEWYERLNPYSAAILPKPSVPRGDMLTEMVYVAALERYGNERHLGDMVFVAPRIFGSYEEENTLKIFTTVYYSSYSLYGKELVQEGGGIIPAAVVFEKNQDGNYSLKEYIEAMDGSYFADSIREFCKPKSNIANDILRHYRSYEDLFDLMEKNLKDYFQANNLKGISMKKTSGEIVPLT